MGLAANRNRAYSGTSLRSDPATLEVRPGIAVPSHESARNVHSSLACVPASERMSEVAGDPMNNHPYILFNKTLEQCRQLGARGGKAYARPRRNARAQGGNRCRSDRCSRCTVSVAAWR